MSTERSAVVTGAASGIGRGIAQSLAARGWDVVGLDVSPATLTIGHHVQGDVRDRSAHEAASRMASERGRLTAWVNCAGIAPEASVHMATAEHLDDVLDVNLKGVFWGCAVAVEAMLESGGAIVNVSSGQALRGRDHYAAYAASKGGILALTTQVAAEYARRGIRCNAVVPGVIRTELNDRILAAAPDPDATLASWSALSPIGRLGTPHDIGELVAFLVDDDAGFITGAHIPIDGGQFSVPPDYGMGTQ